MIGIDNVILKLMEALEPLNRPEELDEELIELLREESVRSSAIWTCSICGARLNGTLDDFFGKRWRMTVISSPFDGWTGYIRITQCCKCRDDPEATKKRMALINMLDNWNNEQDGGEQR